MIDATGMGMFSLNLQYYRCAHSIINEGELLQILAHVLRH